MEINFEMDHRETCDSVDWLWTGQNYFCEHGNEFSDCINDGDC
jgi:hypothetical protein